MYQLISLDRAINRANSFITSKSTQKLYFITQEKLTFSTQVK